MIRGNKMWNGGLLGATNYRMVALWGAARTQKAGKKAQMNPKKGDLRQKGRIQPNYGRKNVAGRVDGTTTTEYKSATAKWFPPGSGWFR